MICFQIRDYQTLDLNETRLLEASHIKFCLMEYRKLLRLDVRGHYVLVSDKPPQEIAMRGNSLTGKAKVVKVAASGLFLSIASCKGLVTLGTSIMKEHQPGEEVSRKMGASSKGVGSKSEPFWLKLSRIAQNQGSSQLGRWDTTKGPVFLLWHLSFPPWKLWVVSDWCCPWKPSMT